MARAEIVVVHARNSVGSAVADRLRSAPFAVTAVPISRTMIDSLLKQHPGVVIVDHDAGAFDLSRVCRDLRASVPSWIIVVSGDGNESDERAISVLDAGADDLLPRSTSTSLLLAHIRVGLRSRPIARSTPELLEVGDVVVDLGAHAAYIGGKTVKCPPRQFLLLAALARSPNVVIGHESLMTTVWGEQTDVVDPRRLRIAVSLLRNVLGSGSDRPRVETVPHVGYRLVVGQPPRPAP